MISILNLFRILSVLFLLGLQAGCFDNRTNNVTDYYQDSDGWKVPKPILDSEKKEHIARPSIQIVDGKKAVLYSTKKQVLLNFNGKDTVVEPNRGSDNVWLKTDPQNQHLYIFWWQKNQLGEEGGKKLFFRGSVDGGNTFSEKTSVNTLNGILPDIDFSSDGKGNLAIIYYDERFPPYRIYTNISTDFGKSWLEKDIRLDNDDNNPVREVTGGEKVPVNYAVDPFLKQLASGKLVAIWQHRKLVDGDIKSQIAVRESDDFGKTWGEEKILYTFTDYRTVEINVSARGDSVAVVGSYPKVGLLGFVGKLGAGANQLEWTSLGHVPQTVNASEVSWLRPAINEKGMLKVAYTVQPDGKSKFQLHVASADINLDKQWQEKPFRLDRDKNQPVETMAAYFDITVLPNDEFAIAWQDYRAILPVVMMDYTNNNGGNWQMKSIMLTRPGLTEIRQPQLLVDKSSLWALFEWNVIRDSVLPRLSYQQFSYDKSTGNPVMFNAPLPKELTKAEKEQKLRQRVKEFMDLRVKKEWEKTWEFMDPVYRQKIKKDSWLKNMGFVSYESYKLNKVEVDGSFGTAELEVTISLPQQVRQDEIMEATPPKTNNSTTKWIWFHDDWFFFPDSTFFRHLRF